MPSELSFQGQPVLALHSGPSEILLCPQHGGRLLSWRYDQRPIIPWPDDADWSQPAKVRGGNPLLFPFIARHYVDGVLGRWRDTDGTVRDLPMHGFARDAIFLPVADAAANTVRLRLTPSPSTEKGYPFKFVFDVVYRLEPNALTLEFVTTNLGSRPMPYSAGHHFYLAIPHAERADWVLHFPSTKTGRQNNDGSIACGSLSSPIQPLDNPDLIDQFHLEASRGDVTLENKRDQRRLIFRLARQDAPEMVPWFAVTTWTQTPESDFYCIEPWLGLPNAIHHGQGLRQLEPGLTEIASCRIEVAAW